MFVFFDLFLNKKACGPLTWTSTFNIHRLLVFVSVLVGDNGTQLTGEEQSSGAPVASNTIPPPEADDSRRILNTFDGVFVSCDPFSPCLCVM